METAKIESAKKYSLNLKDFIKGFIMTALGAIVAALYVIMDAGGLPDTWAEWKPVLMGGLLAGISYIMKNFFSSSDGQFLGKETKPETPTPNS